MGGKDFLAVARELARGRTEAHWRSAAGRAYYAALHKGREALDAWGFPLPPRESIHAFVRPRLVIPSDTDLRTAGKWLELLADLRNDADYRLQSSKCRANGKAQQAVQDADAFCTLLDAITADPARQAAAVAAIRSSFSR
jgi:hypothetical protein